MARNIREVAVSQVVMGCLLVAFFCGMFVTFIYAARHVSGVTDRDYYLHGLDYSKNSEHGAKGVALGWQMNMRVRGDHLEVTVTDTKGQAVSGGTAQFATQTPDGKLATATSFSESEPGTYQLPINRATRGLTGQISFVTVGASIIKRVVINP